MVNWEQVAVQIPIVVAFIWFVLEMDKRNARYAHQRDEQWRQFLHEQAKQFTEALKPITATIGKLVKATERHDRGMQKAVDQMHMAVKLRTVNVKKPRKRNRNV